MFLLATITYGIEELDANLTINLKFHLSIYIYIYIYIYILSCNKSNVKYIE